MNIMKLPRSTYKVDVFLKDVPEQIKSYIERHDLNMNPDFQRGRVWTREQQVKFMEWILIGGQSGTDIYFNQPGWMTHFRGEMVCLDGLQRITAITEFLNNEFPVFNGMYWNEVEEHVNWTDYSFRFHVLKLQTRKQILEWYLIFNQTGTPHTQAELNHVQELLDNE